MLQRLLDDVRGGTRILTKSPGLCATAGILIALVIGGNTTVYSMLNGAIRRPAPGVTAPDIVAFGLVGHPAAPYFDYTAQVLHFGTDGGKVIALDANGTPLAGYPFVPASTTDSIRTALLYVNGILAVGSTTGRLSFLDRHTGAAPALIRQYYFGPTEEVSGISYDSTASRYMVSTADPTTKDGRLYYIDLIADPTPAAP